jgi:hypothetical protein
MIGWVLVYALVSQIGVAVVLRVADSAAVLADPDDLAPLHRRQVARLPVEPGPHRGVDPHLGGAHERLTLGGLGRRQGDQLGVALLDQPGRAAAQQDLAVRQVGHDTETTEVACG